MRFIAASIQMECKLGDKDDNISKALTLIEKAVRMNARLIVLPELFSTGYKVDEMDAQLAEVIPGDTISRLSRKAEQEAVYIIGAILEQDNAENAIYDTAFLIGPQGLIGTYRKILLWGNESGRFRRGSDFPVFHTELGTIGLQICYEIGFPEGARKLAGKGAQIIAYPSAFGAARLYAWDIATRSRALENGIYTLAANRSGSDLDIHFAGHTRIVAPNGEILGEAAAKDEVIAAEIDLNRIDEQRKNIPYLDDLSFLNNEI